MEGNIQEDKPEQVNEINRINSNQQVNENIRKETIYANQNEQKKILFSSKITQEFN
jgi:hypothetical protein